MRACMRSRARSRAVRTSASAETTCTSCRPRSCLIGVARYPPPPLPSPPPLLHPDRPSPCPLFLRLRRTALIRSNRRACGRALSAVRACVPTLRCAVLCCAVLCCAACGRRVRDVRRGARADARVWRAMLRTRLLCPLHGTHATAPHFARLSSCSQSPAQLPYKMHRRLSRRERCNVMQPLRDVTRNHRPTYLGRADACRSRRRTRTSCTTAHSATASRRAPCPGRCVWLCASVSLCLCVCFCGCTLARSSARTRVADRAAERGFSFGRVCV